LCYCTNGHSLSLPIRNMKLPAYELIPLASRVCLNAWQDISNCSQENKLHPIYSTVGIVTHSKNVSRRDAVLLMDSELVILAFKTHSQFTLTIWWRPANVWILWFCDLPLMVKHDPACGISVENISRSLLLRGCSKVSTIVLLSILSKKLIFITKYNVCQFNCVYKLHNLGFTLSFYHVSYYMILSSSNCMALNSV